MSQRREKNTVTKSARWLRRLEDFNARGHKNQKVEPHEKRRKKVGFIEEVEVIPKDEDAKVNPPIEAEEQVLEPSVFQDVCSRTEPLRTKHGEALKVPSMQEIKEAQKQSADTRPKKCKLSQHGIWLVNYWIWVPTELALLLVAVAHGSKAHPGINATAELLQRYFWMENMRKLIQALNKYCLACYGEHLPRTFKRKMGQQIYGT